MMMKQVSDPTISIIVPVYNTEPYLRACLDSVLAQTFSQWECVVVDDGSPDGCPAICDEYAARDSRFVVIHQENGGLSAARNAGVRAASGEYIMLLDSDDRLYHDDALMALSAGMKEYADLSVLVCPNIVYDIDGRLVDTQRFPGDARRCAPTRLFDLIVKTKCGFCGQIFILKRAQYAGGNLYFKVDLLHEDMEWIPRVLASVDEIGVLHGRYYCYRRGVAGSITSRYSEKRFVHGIGIMRDIDNLLKNGGLPKPKREVYAAWVSMMYCLLFADLSNLMVSDKALYRVCRDLLAPYKHALCYRFTIKTLPLFIIVSLFGLDRGAGMLRWYKQKRKHQS